MTSTILQGIVIIACWLLSSVVAASPDGSLFPHIEEPEGKQCVQPEAEMRRNHMNYILHQRDETVHRGIRSSIQNKGYSLAQCIDCHVYPDEDGNIASHHDKEHFCKACHQYAAVQIDCFGCHADKPQKYIDRSRSASLQQASDNTAIAGGKP